jgi:restriction system protein
LAKYPEFESFRQKTRLDEQTQAGNSVEVAKSFSATPHEMMETGYQQIRQTLVFELLRLLTDVTPQKFEDIVIDVLKAMGYGGFREDAAKRVGRSGDGGIDGIINEDPLGLDVVYIQAKRWSNSVPAREIRDFSGSLDERRASKGVFITTSSFNPDAKQFVERSTKRIILIDGVRLAELMIDYGVGVSIERTYKIQRADSDYFSG